MRKALKEFVNRVILFEYNLPHAGKGIPKTILSTKDDDCFRIAEGENLSDIIYHSALDYAWEEYKIKPSDYSNLLEAAFEKRMRFNANASLKTQLRYGFFGEILLCAILSARYGANSILCKGTLYQPNAKRECPGFDSYHLIENEDSIDLWFGEVKFHTNYSQAINSALWDSNSKCYKLPLVLSKEYLQTEFNTLSNRVSNLNSSDSRICEFLRDVENRSFSIIDEAKKYNMKLIYPIFLIYEHDNNSYDDNIRKTIKYIEENYTQETISLGIDLSIFFILLPVKNVRTIKTTVLQWIKEKKPLEL